MIFTHEAVNLTTKAGSGRDVPTPWSGWLGLWSALLRSGGLPPPGRGMGGALLVSHGLLVAAAVAPVGCLPPQQWPTALQQAHQRPPVAWKVCGPVSASVRAALRARVGLWVKFLSWWPRNSTRSEKVKQTRAEARRGSPRGAAGASRPSRRAVVVLDATYQAREAACRVPRCYSSRKKSGRCRLLWVLERSES